LEHNKQIVFSETDGTNTPVSGTHAPFFGIGGRLRRWIFANRIHLIAWSVYIFYEAGLTGIFIGRFGALENYLVHYSLNICLFYFHSFAMQKAVAANKRLIFLRVLCLIIIEIGTYIPVLALLNHFFTAYNQAIGSNYLGITLSFIGGAAYRSIFFILISSGYFFLRQYLSQRAKAGALERANLEEKVYHETVLKDLALAKNAYLRAQMNPHLFFNSLSFIHRRVRKTDKVAGDMIVTLSDMMRYAIESNHTQEMITLSEEVEQVENLISVLRIIHSDEFNLILEYKEKLLSTPIIPLVLITLVENMYKHGELSNMQAPGKIKIYQSENMLTIQSQNQVSKESKAPSLATGLQNLEKRLTDAYQNEVTVDWASRSGIFEVQIDFPLHKSSFTSK